MCVYIYIYTYVHTQAPFCSAGLAGPPRGARASCRGASPPRRALQRRQHSIYIYIYIYIYI